MKAEEWMTKTVQTCRPQSSMSEAAHAMWSGDCGVLPVVNDAGRLVGMVTDRDICMGAHFQGRPMQDMSVADSMSRKVFSCQTSDSIEQVIRRMADEQVRRVPVLDARGKLVGILSLNDIARRIVTLGERERASLASRLVEALAAICEPHAGGVPEVAWSKGAAGRPVMIG